VADPRWGEVGHAFVALGPTNGTGAPSRDEMLGFCRTHLARYKVPKGLTVLPTLPKGSSGKIQKLDLEKIAREGMRP